MPKSRCPNPQHIYKRLVSAYKDNGKLFKFLGISAGDKSPSYDAWMHWLAGAVGNSMKKRDAYLNELNEVLPRPVPSKHVRMVIKLQEKISSDAKKQGITDDDIPFYIMKVYKAVKDIQDAKPTPWSIR